MGFEHNYDYFEYFRLLKDYFVLDISKNIIHYITSSYTVNDHYITGN